MIDLDERRVHGEDAEGWLTESTTVLEEIVVVEIYYYVGAVYVIGLALIRVGICQGTDVDSRAYTVALVRKQKDKFIEEFVDP